MVKVFQNGPGSFLNLIERKNYIDIGFDGVFYIDGQNTGVAMEKLCFAFETVKPVCIMQIEFGDVSHNKASLLFAI